MGWFKDKAEDVLDAFTGIAEGPAKVSDIFNDGIDLSNESLEAFWAFNSGEGNILYDYSGNGNHGMINGATWTEYIEGGCTDSLAENYNDDVDWLSDVNERDDLQKFFDY